MKKHKPRMRRLTAIFLAVVLMTGTGLQAFALTGEVTNRKQATVVEGSTNWSFHLKDTEGYAYEGTCVEPGNGVIPSIGESVSMMKVEPNSKVAKIAYLGSREGTDDVQMYIISRAAARARGEIGANSYSYIHQVNALYDAAGEMTGDIPKHFVVYIAEPSGGGQTMLAWREIKAGSLKLQKIPADASSEFSLAGARYGVYTTWDAADTNDENHRKGVLETDRNGRSNILELLPGFYYVKETLAPDNYELDQKIYKVEMKCNETTLVTSKEELSKGWARVKKVPSENEHLVDACPNQYTLKDAEYDIYTSASLSSSKKVATLITRSDGYSDAVQLPVGTYFAKETKRPKGYSIDETVHKFVVKRNETTTFTSDEKPLFDPINILLSKKDGGGNGNAPSLAGAEFTVEYYDVITDDASGYTASKTWKFKTNASGVVRFQDAFKIGGDNLFKDDSGNPVGLIGTYTIQETKAPKGYIRDSKVYYAHVTENGASNPKTIYNQPEVPNERKEFRVRLSKQDSEAGPDAQGDASLAGAVFGLFCDDELMEQYTTGSDGTFTTEYHTLGDGTHTYKIKELSPPRGYLKSDSSYTLEDLEEETISIRYTTINQTVNNDVIKGMIALNKVFDATDDTGELKAEEGIRFQVYLKSAGSYNKAKATERDVIETDKYGFAQTKRLPYGVYTVHQVNSMDGHERIDDFDVFICNDGETYRYTLNNGITKADLRVMKTDGETGKTIPAENTAFKIWNVTKKAWVSFDVKYPNLHKLDTFMTDETGTFQLPDKLDYGQYELEEQRAPSGYVLSKKRIPFLVDGSEKVITVMAENFPQKGKVRITKTGEVLKHVTDNKDGSYTPVYGEGFLQGAVYEIRAAEDIITPDGTKRYDKGSLVDTVTTGTDGVALSKELYLGVYDIMEITAPDKHILNRKTHRVELTYAGQDVSVTEENLHISNDRQKVKVALKKNLEEDLRYGYDGSGYEDIIFGIFAAEDIKAEDGTMLPQDGLIETIGVVKDGEGYSGTFMADLPHGAYYVQEMHTSEGYIMDNIKYPVNFTYKNHETAVVHIDINGGKAIDNEIVRGRIAGRKIDENGKALCGALIGLFPSDETKFIEENALQTDCSGLFGDFSFEEVAYGKYIVRELKAPKGFALNETSYDVIIDEKGEVIKVEIVDEVTKVEISKIDAATGKMLPGAKLQVLNADEDVMLEFVSGKKAYLAEYLPVGDYVLREKEAPAGYVKCEDIRFSIFDTGDVQKIEMKNDFTKIEIKKIDKETGKPLAGARLQLLDEEGCSVATWVSEETPYYLERIPSGTYTLKELQAPEAYTLAEPKVLEVRETVELQTFVLYNEEKNAPETGDGQHPIGWMAVIVLGGGLLFALKRRRI